MSQEKTEKATPKKREDAKKKGQFAKGSELPTALAFLAALLTITALSDFFFETFDQFFTKTAQKIPHIHSIKQKEVQAIFLDTFSISAMLILPVVIVGMIFAAIGNIAQTGFAITPEALKPKPEKFNPVSNAKRVFGLDGLVNLAKSFVKLIFFGAVAYGVLSPLIINAPTLVNVPTVTVLNEMTSTLGSLALRYGLVMIVLAGADYLYAKYKHDKSLKMSKQEIRDEYKDMEGDPWIKSQRKNNARALVQQRSLGNVPDATVVVTNPTHYSVAIRYDRLQDAAPVVVAKGMDLVAKRIREVATENEVPLYESPPLARALYRSVEPDQVIPMEFFGAVAEILAHVYKKDEQMAEQLVEEADS